MEREIKDDELNSPKNSDSANQQRFLQIKRYNWWLHIFMYIIFLVVGQSAATLLGRLYFANGGNSNWTATIVQSAGFPIWIPFLLFLPRSTNPTMINNSSNVNDPPRQLSIYSLVLIFLLFGIFLAADNLMYSYGYAYLPISTFSLICASQLAFNAAFSFLINSQKLTALIVNSIFLLSASASLIAVHPDLSSSDDAATTVSKRKYIMGFLCTLCASALYSLGLSLLEFSFKKILNKETFEAILNMQIYPSLVATCACLVGLFLSGEWKTLPNEMQNYKTGRVSYVMTLFWTAILWQISTLGLFGLIFEVSSLFSNVISTIALPVIPILGVIFFHDRMDGVKVISLLLAIWGFLSYIYQHYLDDAKTRTSITKNEGESC